MFVGWDYLKVTPVSGGDFEESIRIIDKLRFCDPDLTRFSLGVKNQKIESQINRSLRGGEKRLS